MRLTKYTLDHTYAYDFETTSKSGYVVEKCVRVYAWMGKNLTGTKKNEGITVEEFVDSWKYFKENTLIYFHNGGKFDVNFFLEHIIERYNLTDKLINSKDCTMLIKDNKQSLSIKILLKIVRGKRFYLEIRDSVQLLNNMSIADLGKAQGHLKGDMEYDIIPYWKTIEEMKSDNGVVSKFIKNHRLNYIRKWNGYKTYIYLEQDINILVKALVEFYKTIPEGGVKLTLASTQYILFRKSLSTQMRRIAFPQMKNIDLWNDLNKYYSGGITQIKKGCKQKDFKNVHSYDINSLYPYVMESKLLPIGKPILPKDKGFKLCDLFLYKVKVKHAKTSMFPFISKSTIKFHFDLGYKYERVYSYLDKLKDTTLYMTCVEYNLFEKYYVGKWSAKKTYGFKGSDEMFIPYVNKYKQEKLACDIKGDMLGRSFAKLKLNTLYGKFGENPTKKGRQLQLITRKLKGFEEPLNDKYWFAPVEKILKTQKNVQVALFITAYARHELIEGINNNWKNFIYCDTDSMKLLAPAIGIKESDTTFGSWKFEGRFECACFRANKQYIMKNRTDDGSGKNLFRINGVSRGAKNFEIIPYKDFYTKEELFIKNATLQGHRVKGGILLNDIDKVLRVKDKLSQEQAIKIIMKQWKEKRKN